MTTVAIASTLGGVGKTSLVYHLAWMYADRGLKVLVVDLDPQANLTRLLVSASRLASLWAGDGERATVAGALKPLLDGTGDVRRPHIEHVSENISLIPGDLEVYGAEPEFSLHWARIVQPDARTILFISALYRIVQAAARECGAGVVLMDLAPSLGAVNRTGFAAADYIVVPVSTTPTGSLGLRVLGPVLRRWRDELKHARQRDPVLDLPFPPDAMLPAGYIVRDERGFGGHAVGSRDDLVRRIAAEFHEWVIGDAGEHPASPNDDPYFLGSLKQYRSLMSLANEARKPIFSLAPADGAIGGHAGAVRDAYREYFTLAQRIAQRCKLDLAD